MKAQSHQADGRSDLWALGVILYEMLTGERPFQGDQVRIAYAVSQLEPSAPRRLEANIPADLETICLKCLVKDACRAVRQLQRACGGLAAMAAG